MKNNDTKVCLTIAGLDPSGGAGIIADIKTFTSFKCFATSAVTSITFQNTAGVYGVENQSGKCVRGQLLPVLEDLDISALKTGMLPAKDVIVEAARIIEDFKLRNLVVDPVVRTTSGFDLIDDDALQSLIEKLFPISTIVTPNIPEAERISGMTVNNETDIVKAAGIIQSMGAKNVLIKGGHQRTIRQEKEYAVDFLFCGDQIETFEAEYIETTSTHGTGCTLSAAITALLAQQYELKEAVRIAKAFVTQAIKNAPDIGAGNSPIGIGSVFGIRTLIQNVGELFDER